MRLFSPPLRLRTLSDRWVLVLRPLWLLVFVGAVATVTLGTVYVLREAYEVRPAFKSLGLDYDVESDGVWFEVIGGAKRGLAPGSKWQLTAIDGAPIAPRARTGELAKRLNSARGPVVTLDLRGSDGKRIRIEQKRNTTLAPKAARQAHDLRVGARLTSGLLACGALLLCSLLLVRRRPSDPVAILFAFAFAGMAATIDPPLAMWMAMNDPPAYDVISSVWFYLLLIALAVFPDGIFVPKFYRWLPLVGLVLAVTVSLPQIDPNVQVFLGIGALLAMLVGQVRRYRRLSGGIERQQLKWAAFGFATGLSLLLAAFVLLLFVPDEPSARTLLLTMTITLLFSIGMAAIPLGLLIALTRFRLWEADTVITRSAGYAVVTLIVGVVWAASSDLVKMLIEQVIGRESQAGATTAGAIIAAGIFSPTQSLVLGWTRKRFGSPIERVHEAAKRLKTWGLTETPAEVATRALAIIDEAVHPAAAAIELDTAVGRELIATREVSSAEDPKLIEKLTLADEETSVGILHLGRRSDGNRYSKQELEAVREIIPPLAEALRVARGRYSRESLMQQRLDEMAARLAQLEGGAPKPA